MTKSKGKTTLVTMTGFLEYARVFPENMDNGDYHEKTSGQFNCNFYPENQETFKEYFGAGVPANVLGHDTIRMGNPDFGTGNYVKLKRPNIHPTAKEWGGSPAVFDFREGPSLKKWSYEEDGELGNGTKATVKVSVWSDGKKSIQRLEKIAVLDLVAYDGSKGSSVNMEEF